MLERGDVPKLQDVGNPVRGSDRPDELILLHHCHRPTVHHHNAIRNLGRELLLILKAKHGAADGRAKP